MATQPDQLQYTCGYSFSPPSYVHGALARYQRVRGRRGGGEGECPGHGLAVYGKSLKVRRDTRTTHWTM